MAKITIGEHISLEGLSEIRSRLKHGDIQEVAKDCGFSVQYCYSVFSGKQESFNLAILRSAKKIINIRQKEINSVILEKEKPAA